MKRRKFLKVAGSAGVILAAGSGVFINTRTPHKAINAWKQAGSQYNDPIRNALSYAILAPNPHNRQPWLVDLKNDTEAVLTCDLQRLLPITDPYNRQIIIGLGCFLELFELAANHNGYSAEITLFPEGVPSEQLDTKPIAHMRLVRDSQVIKDPLFLQALSRHTNRNAYDLSRSIDASLLQKITNVKGVDENVFANGVVMGPQLEKLRHITQNALRDEFLDTQALQESIDLMRIGKSEIEANPDGISLNGAFLEVLSILGVLSREALSDPNSESFRIGLEKASEQALTAMGFVWIITLDNSRESQISAGRSYMRITLAVADLGLAMQPMSQALQEYEAMAQYFNQIHVMLSQHDGERVQMLARLGYAKKVQASPRWNLSTRIKISDA